jgi:hypothetical protein
MIWKRKNPGMEISLNESGISVSRLKNKKYKKLKITTPVT